MKNLLIELLAEELPPKALKKLGAAFGEGLLAHLQAQGLCSADSVLTSFATPRRLGAHVTRVLSQAQSKPVQQKLMPVAVGLTAAGEATPALLKKLQALGLGADAVAGLTRLNDGKADVLFTQTTRQGALLAQGLQQALNETLGKLPIPKVMGYQLGASAPMPGWTTVNFVRPVHGLVALHGEEVVDVGVLGLRASRLTQGHRFESRLASIELAHADAYEESLANDGAVVASFSRRRQLIVDLLSAASAKVGAGFSAIDDAALLDEVAALVERPNVLTCEFESEFLSVPQECLILTMKANQKYFPLLDEQGRLSNKFLIVSNISPVDPSAVIQGNERVVRPRLADAKFFYDQDRKKTLISRVAGLSKVVYHNKLGSQGQRSERVQAIAEFIGAKLGGAALAASASRAAMLSKADLVTDMVGEFPELQGIMGGYYARFDGETDAVAMAIEDHYKPRFAGDELPRDDVGVVVALADKLETLVGMFGIGNLPTGDKDPFALRRHALGVLRMLTQARLSLDLGRVIDAAYDSFGELLPTDRSASVEALKTFIFDRLAGMLREAGSSAQEVDAVLSLRPPWAEIDARLKAVRAFASLPEAPALASANKRVSNILRKVEVWPSAQVNAELLVEDAEKQLAIAIESVASDAINTETTGQFTENLQLLAALKAPVDEFFESVMVNADDPAVRANRLGLLAKLHAMMNTVADLSKLAA